MSFLYPRTIKVTRPQSTVAGIGAQPYGGSSPQHENVIASDVQASIQAKRTSVAGQGIAGLPGDVPRTIWEIYFNQPKGTLKDRDIIIDDEGFRYQVIAAYWNSLGYKVSSVRLEA